LIDLRHGLLETKLDKEIIHKNDLIAGDPEVHSLLQMHYQSIMDQIHFTVGETHDTSTSTHVYAIENTWTMKAADAVGARERHRREEIVKKGLERTWESMIERGRTMEVDGSQPTVERDRLYLERGWIEGMRQSLDAARGRWIDSYMELVTREARHWLESKTTTMRRIDGQPAENERVIGMKADGDEELEVVVEEGLIDERLLIEKLFVYEVEAWDGLVGNWVKEFMSRNDVPESEKERLTREWRGNCWKRLDTNTRAMDARMEDVKAEISALPSNELQRTLNSKLKDVHNEIRGAWQSVIEQLIDTPTLSTSNPSSGNL
jgi:Ribonuclease G/E